MSEYEEYDDEYYEEDNGMLSEEEILEIQEEYRRRRLIESLIGPIVSTIFHVLLIIVLAIFITDKVKEPIAEIEVVMEEIEEVEIEPPPVEQPEPEDVEPEETTNPTLTTVAIENVETNDEALEDTNDEAPSTDDSMADQAVSDVVVSPSAFASPSVYGGRSASGRASAVSKFGGNKVGQAALLKALWWLAKVQNPNGSWGSSNQQAFTGLALLTFLAHGETPTSKHFGKTVKKAMQWLSNDPMKKNHGNGYGHAIKTYALAEAYAMTGVSMLEAAMNKGIRIVIDGQQEKGCFTYSYGPGPKQDLSVAGWNFQALKAAYGAGCEEKGLQEAIYKAIEWLKIAGDTEKGFPYDLTKQENGSDKHTMRAVGCLCLQLFGEGKTAEIQDDLKKIATTDLAKYSWNNPPRESLYGWYYATQAMFQNGGVSWKAWNRKFQKELTDNQNKEGYWEYPGDFHGKMDPLTTRIYATTLSALQLTVYYRYLPSSKGAIGAKAMDNQAAEKKKEKVMEEEGLDLVD
ncbi:MAG: hypothetical protein NE328_04945 [Lentisphaeraceae bacterium]|nr:hypothetical protein [Lentisphaeraceae bacterium]